MNESKTKVIYPDEMIMACLCDLSGDDYENTDLIGVLRDCMEFMLSPMYNGNIIFAKNANKTYNMKRAYSELLLRGFCVDYDKAEDDGHEFISLLYKVEE